MKHRFRAYLRYPFWIFVKSIYKSLAHLEDRWLVSTNRKLKYPPIFIIGPPRSGTTLLYQLIVHCFHVAYFPNVAAMFPEAPVLATRIGRKLFRPYKSNFTSTYGLVQGWMAPHEAGQIWNRWFPTEWKNGYNYTPAGHFADAVKHLIYQTVAGIEAIFDAPFVNKNVKHSVRIQALSEIFPSALFLQMKRNPLDVAISILHSRRERCENINDWWSVMPKEINQLKHKDVLEQIVGQIFFIEQDIKEDVGIIGHEHLFVVYYEELCDNPQGVLNDLKLFINKHGGKLKPKYPIPNAFKRAQSGKNASRSEVKKLEMLLKEYYGQQKDREI